MSLWYKQVDQITFHDVEDFCQLRQREGRRLDYKRTIPNDLENLVAAFANTLGGLIILGVDSDRQTNEPIWPPAGMPATRGIEEQIIQICRDNTYPPIRPQISAVLSNPHANGTVVTVVRVDDSPEAPHAVDQGRAIYERTGNQNHPYQLAHIDGIQHLLSRRQRIEEQRLTFIKDQLARSARQLAETRLQLGQLAGIRTHQPKPPTGPQFLPLRWVSVIPFYPWRDLCEPEVCWQVLGNWRDARDVQRVPGGAFAVRRSSIGQQNFVSGCSSLTSKGHFFAIECTLETVHNYQGQMQISGDKPDYRWLNHELLCEFAQDVIKFSAGFYRQPIVELPGFVLLSVGIMDALGFRMGRGQDAGKQFVDEHFRADTTVLVNELLENPSKAAAPLFEQVAFGFDLPPVTNS